MSWNYYFSGTPRNDSNMSLENSLFTHRLASCHGDYLKNVVDFVIQYDGSPDNELLLDSGAFTAWNKGHITTLDECVSAYSRVMDVAAGKFKHIWMINLDRIPGERGRTATPEEIEEAIRISDENFEELVKRFGPVVLPVFHQDESIHRLEEVKKQAQYICVSPRNDLPERTRVSWSNRAHGYCKGWKTHGLATTGYAMQKNSPWYSVDSAAWVLIAGYGRVLCEDTRGRLVPIGISDDSPTVRNLGEHFCHLPDSEQQRLEASFREINFSVDEVKGNGRIRALVNMHHIMKWLRKQAAVETKYQSVLFEL